MTSKETDALNGMDRAIVRCATTLNARMRVFDMSAVSERIAVPEIRDRRRAPAFSVLVVNGGSGHDGTWPTCLVGPRPDRPYTAVRIC